MNIRLSKTISILAVTSLFTAGVAIAQVDRNPPDRQHDGRPSVERQLEHLSRSLRLSDEQAVDMLVVLQENAEQKAALHRMIMEQMRPQICAQKAATDQAILEILTPEQTERYLRVKERKAHKPVRRGSPDC